MKRVIFSALVTLFVANAHGLAQTIQAPPSAYNFPGVEYPRIESDSRVTFRFHAPDAEDVQVSIVNVPFDMGFWGSLLATG